MSPANVRHARIMIGGILDPHALSVKLHRTAKSFYMPRHISRCNAPTSSIAGRGGARYGSVGKASRNALRKRAARVSAARVKAFF